MIRSVWLAASVDLGRRRWHWHIDWYMCGFIDWTASDDACICSGDRIIVLCCGRRRLSRYVYHRSLLMLYSSFPTSVSWLLLLQSTDSQKNTVFPCDAVRSTERCGNITNRRAISATTFPIGSLLNTNGTPKSLSFRDTYSIKGWRHTDTSTDNKGRLKFAAREPILLILIIHYTLV